MSLRKFRENLGNTSIRYHIFVYFTVSALVILLLTGISLYSRMTSRMTSTVQEANQILINQVNRSLDSYLRALMKLSDSLYYGAVKNVDLSSDLVEKGMSLLYDSSRDTLENIALFSREGNLLEAMPAARLKTNLDITREAWFQEALDKTENIHFGLPHVQYVFDNNENQYRWVMSLSRAVEITEGATTRQGILLMDVRYTSLEQLLENVSLGNGGYLYLISSRGEIIYHPQIQLIDAGISEENHKMAAQYRDGTHEEVFRGERRMVTVKSVGYTGWKLVGVTPNAGIFINNIKTRIFVIFILALFLFVLMAVNAYISSKITDPIKALEKSVNELEAGVLNAEVYCGGSYEIRRLGKSIQKMAGQIQVLMNDIVAEHEQKRRSEFDTLQSQINPHFLYNTLDIIVWMIENERQSEAVRVVTALARFFRISLSKGKNIIPVQDELEHVRNYLMIQNMRFKNKFSYEIQAGEQVQGLASLKLMLQPLVENAIYHGMEFMDGDGQITVRAYSRTDGLYFEIQDNGLGMTQEQVSQLLADRGHVSSKKGSGIGVRNVNERIKLYFGQDYGLEIDSEPDEGTTIRIHLPAVPYEEMLARETSKSL